MLLTTPELSVYVLPSDPGHGADPGGLLPEAADVVATPLPATEVVELRAEVVDGVVTPFPFPAAGLVELAEPTDWELAHDSLYPESVAPAGTIEETLYLR